MSMSANKSQFSRFNSVGGGGGDWPDPFADMASAATPSDMRNALQWAQYIYMSNGTYRMAMERIISYFLTDIEIGDADDEENDKYDDFLRNTLDIMVVLQNKLRNRICYGNDFSSVLVPFKRFLCCPKCGYSAPLKVVHSEPVFAFNWTNYEFHASCPSCKFRGKWRVDDKPDDEEKKIQVKTWSPHEIELLHDPYTDNVAYLWRIPEDYKMLVRRGNLYHLERVSMPVLDAIKHNQMFRFNDDVIYHMKEPTLCGINNRGWGIPRILSNFRQIWYVQVLRRYNEAIALDYVIPFRVITPAPRAGGGGGAGGGQAVDPLMMFGGGDFRAQVNGMIRRRRRDPASFQVLPFPVQYQMLGGDANQLAPRDLIDQGVEQLLNDAGTPVELYKGSLQLQTAPVALRLFEATWHHLVHDANNFLQWLVRQLSQIMSWEAVDVSLRRVTIADDMQKQMALLQLMMGQQISGTTALKALGLEWKQEQQRLGEEAREQAEIQSRIQEEMQQSGFADQVAKGQMPGDPSQQGAQGGQGGQGGQAGAAPPPGGAVDPATGQPMQGPVSSYLAQMGPNTPITPQDQMAAADQLSQELLGLPDSIRRSELMKLKSSNEVLHSLVRARMDSIRQQVRLQAGAAQGV